MSLRPLIPFFLTLAAAAVFALRLFGLGELPGGLHADEASYGYDAYALMTNGHDQWGSTWPLTFKSFGEYKLNLPYLILPFVKIFGLTTLATRAPSAVFGLLTSYVLYLTLNLLHKDRRLNVFLALVFATSPWAFGISRVFFESNSMLFFLAFGLYTTLRALKLNKLDRLYLIGAASLALSNYLYPPARYFSLTILACGPLFVARRSLPLSSFLPALLIYLTLSLPLTPQLFSSRGLVRLVQESKLRDFESGLVIEENRRLCYLSLGKNPATSKLCYLYWNKPVLRTESLVKTALTQSSPNYLFFESADTYIVPPGTGPYLYYLLPLFVVGFYFAVKNRNPLIYTLLIVYALSQLATGLAGKVTLYRNPLGLYLMFFPIAYGLYFLRSIPGRLGSLVLALVIILAVFFQSRYLTHYFLVFPKQAGHGWADDAGEVAAYLIKHENDYRLLVDKSADDFGPLYYAFYSRYDPALFLARAEWTTGDPAGWTHVGKLGKIVSKEPRDLKNFLCEKAAAPATDLSVLYVTAPLEDFSRFADHQTTNWNGELVLHEFYDLDSLFDQLVKDNPANITRLCPLEAANSRYQEYLKGL